MKAINIVLGIGLAVIMSSLIVLGIKAFYPAPQYPEYPKAMPSLRCAPNDTKCLQDQQSQYQQQQQQQDQYQAQQKDYQDAMKVYSKNVFVIANIVGIVVFLGGFLFLLGLSSVTQGVPLGIMISGLWGIVYGYAVSWVSVDDRFKFLVGLVIVAMLIVSSLVLAKRYRDSRQPI